MWSWWKYVCYFGIFLLAFPNLQAEHFWERNSRFPCQLPLKNSNQLAHQNKQQWERDSRQTISKGNYNDKIIFPCTFKYTLHICQTLKHLCHGSDCGHFNVMITGPQNCWPVSMGLIKVLQALAKLLLRNSLILISALGIEVNVCKKRNSFIWTNTTNIWIQDTNATSLLTANVATIKSISHSFLNLIWICTMPTACKHHCHVPVKNCSASICNHLCDVIHRFFCVLCTLAYLEGMLSLVWCLFFVK